MVDIQVNRLRVLDRLADDLAHEVKNPLNAVIINLELLKRRVTDGQTEDALERAERVEAEVRRVHVLVDALFQVMRPGCDAGRTVDLDGALREVLPLIELQAKLARVTLERWPGCDDARVAVRPFTLKQAILTLVAGVIDAAPDGRIELRTRVAGDAVELHVGCSAAHAALRAEAEHWAVARVLLADAGGRIDIEPVVVGGARIVLRLARAHR